jgi:hypothetical protein
MTQTSLQTTIHERVEPVLEALISGLVETAPRSKTEALTKDAVMTLALVGALMRPPSPRWAKPRTEVTLFGTVLASALAAALAPALAQALTPAIVQALVTKTSTEKPGQEKPSQESASSEGSEKSEHHQ